MFRTVLFAAVVASTYAQTLEEHALRISQNIQARHMPFGTILNPLYASATSTELVTYTRCGDSAIWTGHYLAAEAFRYFVLERGEAFLAKQFPSREPE